MSCLYRQVFLFRVCLIAGFECMMEQRHFDKVYDAFLGSCKGFVSDEMVHTESNYKMSEQNQKEPSFAESDSV